MAWSTFPLQCCCHHHPSPEIFSLPKLTVCPLNTTSLSPLSLAPGNHCFTFCFCDFDYSECIRSAEPILFVLSWLAYFTAHNVLKVLLCCRKCQNFLPFKGWIIYNCMNIPHFVYPFIYWWTPECLRLLSVMKNAAMYVSIQVSVQVLAFSFFFFFLNMLRSSLWVVW